MEKRGISSLITVVLIIGLVIGLSVIIFGWQSGFIKSIIGKSDFANEKSLTCLNDVEILIKDSCYNNTENPTVINLLVENKVSKDLKWGFIAKVFDQGELSSVEISPPYPVLEAYSVKEIQIFTNFDNPISIEIVPMLKINDKLDYCNDKSKQIALKGC